MPQIFVLSGSSVGRSFEVHSGATFGRSPDCTIVLKDRSISRQHAHLEEDEDGGWALCDDGSRNGIAIGDEKHERVVLPDGQEFLCGEVLMRFRSAAPAPVPAAAPAPEPRVEPEPVVESLDEGDDGEIELELSEGGGFATPKGPAPAVPAEAASADDEEDGVAFEDADDIDLAGSGDGAGLEATMVNPRVAPPAPVSPDAKKVGLGPPSRERLAEQRGRVLQYHRAPESDSLMSFELSQLPAWKRYALYLVAFAVLAGVFGATVFGTSFLKGKVAPSETESDAVGGD